MGGTDPVSETGMEEEVLDGFLDGLWDDEKLDAWIASAGAGAHTLPVPLVRGAGKYKTTCTSTAFVNSRSSVCMCVRLSASKGASESAAFRPPCCLMRCIDCSMSWRCIHT